MIVTPFTLIVDTREQKPLSFSHIRERVKGEKTQLLVKTKRHKLDTGDYSIEGYEDQIVWERKSVPDAYSTFTRDRKRWERELERMLNIQYRFLIIEADEKRFYDYRFGQHVAKSVYRSLIAWELRYGLRVHFCHTRNDAARRIVRTAERFWKDHGGDGNS